MSIPLDESVPAQRGEEFFFGGMIMNGTFHAGKATTLETIFGTNVNAIDVI